MIVTYHGTGPQSPDLLQLEHRTLSRDLFTVRKGQSVWLPDTYIHIDSLTGEDTFRRHGITVLVEPAPLARRAFSRARDGEALLITRQYGGIGDIVMQTMLWPNLRRMFPSSRLTYALPMQFHPLLEGNPDLDEVTDPGKASRRRFDHVGDISRICGEVENAMRPCTIHRADIWGEHLGIEMATHEARYTVHPHEAAWAARYVAALRPRPIVALVPYSASRRKDLPDATTQGVIDGLVLDLDCEVGVLHDVPTRFRRAHSLHDLSLRWLGAFLTQADLVISVDTGPMHLAAILKRPTLAIYGSEDGRVFTKYYPTVRLLQTFHRACQPCWYRTPCLVGEPTNSRPGDCLVDRTPETSVAEAETLLRESRHA